MDIENRGASVPTLRKRLVASSTLQPIRRDGMPTWRIHRRRHGPPGAGAVSVVAPDTAIGCAHVARPGRALGEPVAEVHGALRSGYRRLKERDVRRHRATVEHLLA